MRSGFYAATATDESLKPRLWVVWMMLFYSSSSRNGTASAVRSPRPICSITATMRPLRPSSSRQHLPDRKRSPDIVDRRAEYAEREAAANEREQYGRFHAVNRFLIDVQLVGEVGHGSNLQHLPTFSPSTYL